MKTKTNITKQHQQQFEALRDQKFSNFALFSCFVNGQPSSAIVSINENGGVYDIRPLFVAVTEDMVLTDHEGQQPIDLKGGI